MKKFDVKDHAPSLLPDGYEFDGDALDTFLVDHVRVFGIK